MWGSKHQGGRANKPRIPSAEGGEKHADSERQAARNDRYGQGTEAQASDAASLQGNAGPTDTARRAGQGDPDRHEGS